MKKLKAGIIGLGVGEQHIAGYHKHPQCEVIQLCDFAKGKREMAQSKYPQMKICENAEEVLTNPDIDVVSIASFDNFHCKQILQAIENEKHVFVEKPFCLSPQEAKRIRKALNKKQHIFLSSNLILRKCPRFLKLKKMIQQGVLGEIYSIEGDYNYGRIHKILEGWRGKLDFYSVIYGGGVHIVDLFLWLINDKVVQVTAYGNKFVTKKSFFRNFDFVSALLYFESGIIGKVSANFGCVYPHFHNLVLYGTKATFCNNKEHGVLVNSRSFDNPPTYIQEDYPGYHKGEIIYSFIHSILNECKADVEKEEVFESMSVCFAIEESAQTSKTIEVNYI